MSGKDLCIGIIIGAALGAAVAYLSNEKRRNDLCDDIKDFSDKAQDSLVDAYNKAKSQYGKYKRKLQNKTEDFASEVESRVEEVLD